MSNKPFRAETLPSPPPAFPRHPPGRPPQHPPAPPSDGRRRWWPTLAAAGGISAVVSAAPAAVITLQVRNTSEAPQTSAPVTITVPAPAPPTPAPLPAAQADRQTCQEGWLATAAPARAATDTLSVLPPQVKILDPAVRANPDWTAAVERAGDFYRQASETLQVHIAPGTTPILAEASNTAVKAFRVLGDAYSTFDPISGNAHDIAKEASDEMAVLCTRLAP